MTPEAVLRALDLPPGALVDRRIPKAALAERVACSPGDRRRIAEGLEQLRWHAVLKPETVGLPAAAGPPEVREVQVLVAAFRPGPRTSRLHELVHRAVAYPALLVVEAPEPALSLAWKRPALDDAKRVVLDGPVHRLDWQLDAPDEHGPAFLAALALGAAPRSDLAALYQGWLDAVLALQAARRTGRFVLPAGSADAARRREALLACDGLEATIDRLRAAARRERQTARRVDLNLELRRRQAELSAALGRL